METNLPCGHLPEAVAGRNLLSPWSCVCFMDAGLTQRELRGKTEAKRKGTRRQGGDAGAGADRSLNLESATVERRVNGPGPACVQ